MFIYSKEKNSSMHYRVVVALFVHAVSYGICCICFVTLGIKSDARNTLTDLLLLLLFVVIVCIFIYQL